MSQGLGFTVTAWFFLSFRLGGYEQLPDLKHTFATLALQNGVDIQTVSGMLGRFSAGFTLDTYAHVTSAAQNARRPEKWPPSSPVWYRPFRTVPRLGHGLGQG